MRYACFLLFVLLGSEFVSAQPVFPSWDEYRLSEVKCNPRVAPAPALQRDGSGRVFWDQAAQRIGSDGRPMGVNTSSFGFSGAAIALEDGSYALLSSSRIVLAGYSKYRYDYVLRHVDDSALRDSSPVLYSASHAGFLPDAQDSEAEYSVHPGLFASPFGVHLAWNVLGFHGSDYAGVYAQCRLGMDRWNPYAHTYARIIDEQSYSAPTPPMGMSTPFPMAFHRLSDALDGVRYRFLRRPTDPRDDSTFVRLIIRLSPGSAILSETVIDTIPARGTDLSTLPIPSPAGVDLLQRRAGRASPEASERMPEG